MKQINWAAYKAWYLEQVSTIWGLDESLPVTIGSAIYLTIENVDRLHFEVSQEVAQVNITVCVPARFIVDVAAVMPGE